MNFTRLGLPLPSIAEVESLLDISNLLDPPTFPATFLQEKDIKQLFILMI
jgi:hypothetical protein